MNGHRQGDWEPSSSLVAAGEGGDRRGRTAESSAAPTSIRGSRAWPTTLRTMTRHALQIARTIVGTLNTRKTLPQT